MNYEEKKAFADKYIDSMCGMNWDTLPDINSLHDAETEDDIRSLCDDRLADTGFPFTDIVDEDL